MNTLKEAIAIPQTPEERFDAFMLALNKMQPELTALLNRCGVDNAMDTPDYLLSEFIMDILIQSDKLRRLRAAWFDAPETKDKKEAEG